MICANKNMFKTSHFFTLKYCSAARQWWSMPLIPAVETQRQADLYEFEAHLVYKS